MEIMGIARRDLQPDDVQFQVLCCGIYHSDLHWAKNDFGFSSFPMVPEHEIVGRVTAVTRFKPGDLAAVDCIVDSCGSCPACQRDLKMFCNGEGGTIMSCNSPDRMLGDSTFGGVSQSYVCKEKYTLHMPEGVDLAPRPRCSAPGSPSIRR